MNREVTVRQTADGHRASAQELLPLDDVIDSVICLRGGDYRAVIEAQSVNFALQSETEREAIMAGYRAFLNALSYQIQVIVRVLPTDVEAYLMGLRERLGEGSGEAVRRLALDHESFVRKLARDRTLLERRFYVIVPAGLGDAFEPRGIRWPWHNRSASRHQNFEAAASQLAHRCQEIAGGLGAFGVVTRWLGSEELVQLWSSCLDAEAATGGHSALMPLPVVSGLRQERAVIDA
jgi:hypothetical protein